MPGIQVFESLEAARRAGYIPYDQYAQDGMLRVHTKTPAGMLMALVKVKR